MEYVEGRTLADFLSGGGRIMPDRAIDIAEDVLTALEAAHAQGVIHRDIKPGNIMLSPEGEVKVTDFGIARVTTTDTVAQTAAILGTASYLSPEQAQGQPVDGRSDAQVRAVRDGDGPPAVPRRLAGRGRLEQVLEQPLPPSKLNPDVTPELDAVIRASLAKNPANRYQSAEEMRPTSSASSTACRWRRRRCSPPGRRRCSTAAAAADDPGPPAAEPERKRRVVPIAVTLVLIGLLGLLLWFLATTFLADENGQTGVQVAVPDVVGESRSVAEQTLEADLVPMIERRVPAAERHAGARHGRRPGPRGGHGGRPGIDRRPHDRRAAEHRRDPEPPGRHGRAQAQLLELGLEPAGRRRRRATRWTRAVTRTDLAVGEEVEEDAGHDLRLDRARGGDRAGRDLSVVRLGAAGSRRRLVPVAAGDTAAEPACARTTRTRSRRDPAAGTVVQPGQQVTLFPREEPAPPDRPHRRDRRG